MTASGKGGGSESVTRGLLLDATTQIMLEEGYAAATSRRVAARAGVKSALVHYYFPTMDDLYLAVFREGAQANLDRQQEALGTAFPLRAMWESASESRGNRLLLEFMALANHRKRIRSEIAQWAERWRAAQISALTDILAGGGDGVDKLNPAAVSVLMACAGRMLVLEDTLGIETGHPEALELIQRFLDRVEPPPGG
jgi:AcrR family transcriptional regulator